MDRTLTEPVAVRAGGRGRRAIFQWFSYQCVNNVHLRQKNTGRPASENFTILIVYVISAK